MKNHLIRVLIVSLVSLLFFSYPLSVLAGVFGVGVYLNGEPDGDKVSIANSMSDLGISITRMEINYSNSINWNPSDQAVELTRARGIENLILLGYDGDRPSVDTWGDFVHEVASRYTGKTAGYEIFNEADNYISGTDYASYLWRSYDKIKDVDSGAKIIVSGLTARSEATSFWNGIYSAGAWDKFDALGLHPYRDEAPEVVKYNIGDFTTSVNIAANYIRAKGGGKKIWLTEFGVQSSTVGDTSQANYIARSYIMSRTVPEIEKVMMYRYRDGENWGMVRSDLSHKTLYDRYKNVIDPLDYSGTAERIYAYDTQSIDNFESVSGWKTDESSGGSLGLSETSGYSGGGMKYDYSFSAANGYVIAKKTKELSENPAGLGLWAKGSSTASVLKLRIKDANGETFQFDLGKVTSDWNFYKFDFGLDSAKTSWGGNSNIDYPIKFDSIVYDRQGGSGSGTLYLDEVVAISGAADLYSYKLGSKLAYWKVSGSKTSSVCGKSLTFYEEPQITDVNSCSVWPTSSSSNSSSSVETTPIIEETQEASSGKTISKTKSKISADKEKAKADGQEAVTLTMALRSANDEVIASSKLALEVSGSNNIVSELKKEGDDYKATISSTKAEEKEIKVKIGSWELGSLKVTFEPGNYSRANSLIVPNKWVAKVNESIDLELKVRDANDNDLLDDKKPTKEWQLSVVEGNAQLTQPSKENNWKGSITVYQPGKIVLMANYNNEELSNKVTLYFNPILIEFDEIPQDKIHTITKDQQIKLSGSPKDNIGLKLEGIEAQEKVIVKISSTPTYFALTKNKESGQYQETVVLPSEEGRHQILIYSENTKGETTEFAKGAIDINLEGEIQTTPVWTYALIGLGGLTIIVLTIVLAIPKSRMKIIWWWKSIELKLGKNNQ